MVTSGGGRCGLVRNSGYVTMGGRSFGDEEEEEGDVVGVVVSFCGAVFVCVGSDCLSCVSFCRRQ